MIINDPVYGKIAVTESVLVELIKSKPIQRLKFVNQAGSQLVFPNITTTRFEHSVGVMYLLKIKGAPPEEQIAGLLHDVPHTAFSHAMDYLFKTAHLQNYHEQFLEKMIFESEIPSILKKYGFDPKRVVEHHHFSMLEQPLPALCADRIDYSIRDLLVWKIISPKNAREYLEDIIGQKGKFAMKSKKIALDFATKYVEQSENSWISARTMTTFQILADAVKKALAKKLIDQSALFSTDNTLLKKLNKLKDKEIQKNLGLLTPSLKIFESKKDFDYHLKGKTRFVDPSVLVNGKVQKLSKLDKQFAAKIKDYLARMRKGKYIKIIN